MVYDIFDNEVYRKISNFLYCVSKIDSITHTLGDELAGFQENERMASANFDNPPQKASLVVIGRSLFETRADIKHLKKAILASNLFQEWVKDNQEPLEKLKMVFGQMHELVTRLEGVGDSIVSAGNC